MARHVLAALIGVTLLTPLALAAQDRPLMTIPIVSGPVELDGFSNEPAWAAIQPIPLVMFSPTFGQKPTERTEIRVAHDAQYLYVSGRMYDSDPSGIRATSLRRDDGSLSNDWLALNLDTFGNGENTAVFGVTPSGVQTDLMWDDIHTGTNFDWNTFWDVAVQTTNEGWFAEIRIPFSSLRFQDHDGRVTMRLAAWRNIARKNEIMEFPSIPPNWGFFSMMKGSQMQPIVLEGVRSRRPLYATPYVIGGTGFTNSLSSDRERYSQATESVHDFGADLKYGITNNLTLDASYNTDFAQVEADDQQVNLTRFSLFFPEKRQFFQERASVFSFSTGGDDQLFYSRRIGLSDGRPVPIYGGARLVGRFGDWDVGFIDMQTASRDELPSENFGVLRLRRPILNSGSSIGAIMTTRRGGTGNSVYGLDGLFHLRSEDYLTLNAAQSFTAGDPAALDRADRGLLRANWERRGEDGLRYNFDWSHVGPLFNPAVGYIMRNDYTRLGNAISYGWRPGSQSRLLRHKLSLSGSTYQRNSDHKTETSTLGPEWEFEMKTGATLELSAVSEFEDLREPFELASHVVVPMGGYRFQNARASYDPSTTSLFRTGASIEGGQFYDGRRMAAELTPTWNASRYLELGGAYQINRITFSQRDESLIAQVARVRARLMMNTRLSGAMFVQYNSASSAISANVRIRYTQREGNDLYIVFNDGLNTDREAFQPVRPLTDTRTLLVKYSRTFDMGF